jgi:hypothetical protein
LDGDSSSSHFYGKTRELQTSKKDEGKKKNGYKTFDVAHSLIGGSLSGGRDGEGILGVPEVLGVGKLTCLDMAT